MLEAIQERSLAAVTISFALVRNEESNPDAIMSSACFIHFWFRGLVMSFPLVSILLFLKAGTGPIPLILKTTACKHV